MKWPILSNKFVSTENVSWINRCQWVYRWLILLGQLWAEFLQPCSIAWLVCISVLYCVIHPACMSSKSIWKKFILSIMMQNQPQSRNIWLFFYHYSLLSDGYGSRKGFFVDDKELHGCPGPIYPGKNLGCWWSDDDSSQIISSHGIGLIPGIFPF